MNLMYCLGHRSIGLVTNSIFKLLWKIDLLTRDHRKFGQFLDVSACNNLKSLPDAIGGLASLQTLNLNLCVKLSCLPKTIGNLARLQTLDLTCCFGQKTLPETLGQMTSLQYFSAFMCLSMHKLPESIGKLTALKELNFRNCDELINIPVPIGKLKSLRSLDLSTAQLRKPSEFKVGKIYTEDMTSELPSYAFYTWIAMLEWLSHNPSLTLFNLNNLLFVEERNIFLVLFIHHHGWIFAKLQFTCFRGLVNDLELV